MFIVSITRVQQIVENFLHTLHASLYPMDMDLGFRKRDLDNVEFSILIDILSLRITGVFAIL